MKALSKFTAASLLAGAVVAATLLVDVDSTGVGFGPREAQAIVGRPLTPVSYAGVARRTVRRTAYVGAAAYAGARLATLPAGCVAGVGVYYQCGAVRYQAVYDGPNVVYVQR